MGGDSENQTGISILMAARNGEEFIEEQIRSIQAQSHVRWQLYIADDRSQDRTLQIVRRISATDGRIHLIEWRACSGSAARNFLRSAALIPPGYAMFCDQDDVWLPDKIQRTLRAMTELEESVGADTPCLVHTDARVVGDSLQTINGSLVQYAGIKTANSLPTALAVNCVTGCTMMVNARLLELFVETSEGSVMVMHDWWAYLIAETMGRRRFLSEPTVLYRQHGGNAAGAVPDRFVAKTRQLENSRLTNIESVHQARDFFRTYGDKMAPARREVVREYGALSGERPLARVAAVRRLRTVKPTFTGRVVQMISLLTMRQEDR